MFFHFFAVTLKASHSIDFGKIILITVISLTDSHQ